MYVFMLFFFIYVGDLIQLLFWTAESWLCLNRHILLATRGVPVGVRSRCPFPGAAGHRASFSPGSWLCPRPGGVCGGQSAAPPGAAFLLPRRVSSISRAEGWRLHQKLPSSQPVDHNLMMIIDYFAAFHSLWHCGQP